MELKKIKFPKVDNGVIYDDIDKVICNGDFTFDKTQQLTMSKLQKMIPDYPFVKIADCVLNIKENFPYSNRSFIDGEDYEGKLVDYIPVSNLKSKWDEIPKEWIYTIVYDGYIVKIGMTSSGLAQRYGSYNTGTVKAMRKGSCATTNFVVTQCNYLALLQGTKVEIFAYEIPQVFTEEVIFGRNETVLNKMAHKYETTLIKIYEDKMGRIPYLCG